MMTDPAWQKIHDRWRYSALFGDFKHALIFLFNYSLQKKLEFGLIYHFHFTGQRIQDK